MIILECTFRNPKIVKGLISNSLMKENQDVFNSIDDKEFFNFIFNKIEDSLPTDNDEYYTSDISQEYYQSIFNSFELSDQEINNQRNYIDAYTFPDSFYEKNMSSEYLENIENNASIGCVECFPKFTKYGVVWDVSSEDWEGKEYRVYSGLTYSQLTGLDMNELIKLIISEKINDDVKNEVDFLKFYPEWDDDKEYVYDEIWGELEEINREELILGRLLL